MRIIVVGCGGREHALFKKMIRHDMCCIGPYLNPGIKSLVKEYFLGNTNDNQFILKCCQNWNPSLVVIGPEAPLENGITDLLRENGFPCFGPSKNHALIETSKFFAREMMNEDEFLVI